MKLSKTRLSLKVKTPATPPRSAVSTTEYCGAEMLLSSDWSVLSDTCHIELLFAKTLIRNKHGLLRNSPGM